MSIGIDFILRANSAQFTRGLAQANNSLKSLKHSLREGDVGGGIKRLLGAGAVIEGMRAIMGYATDVRKSLEEMGKPVPDDIASVARLSDGFKDLKDGAMEFGVKALSVFTGIGESAGDVINKIREGFGAKLVDSGLAESIAEAADKSVAASEASMKKIMAANSPDALKSQAEKLEESKRKHAQDQMSAWEKLNDLRSQAVKLEERLAAIDPNTKNQALIGSLKQQIEDKNAEITAQQKAYYAKSDALYTDKFQAENDKQDAEKKLADRHHDKYLGTVEQLSNSQITEGMDPVRRQKIIDAQKIMQLEALSGQQGFAGKLDLSDQTQSQADKLRAGLGGFVKSDETSKDADIIKTIDESNVKLESIDRSLKGLVKVSQ